MALKTDYKDDVFTGNRKYNIIDNADGTKSLVDATTYEQVGDTFGALDINSTNKAVNDLNSSSTVSLTTTWTLDSTSNKYYQDITITGVTTDNVIDINPITASLTKAQEEAYLELFNKLCANNETIAGGLRVYANEEITTAITVELRLVK